MRLRTCSGEVRLTVAYGLDPQTRQWGSPFRELLGLGPHEVCSAVLEDRLCFTALEAGSFERAAAVAEKWGSPVSDSLIHAHVQKVGKRALAAEDERVEQAVEPATRGEVVAVAKAHCPAGCFSLVTEVDGWMARERGVDWGKKPREASGERVVWREQKTAVLFTTKSRLRTKSGRGFLQEKVCVVYEGEPFEFGQRLFAEALRQGSEQARIVFYLADGGPWIWLLRRERFPRAKGQLDLYHGLEHLWTLAHTRFEEHSSQAREWVEPLKRLLEHGGEKAFLAALEALPEQWADLTGEARKTLEREVAYFQTHRHHLHYERNAAKGCPMGSGAIESVCAEYQTRFKRPGQFWSAAGKRRLQALENARRNGDWDEVLRRAA